jgi:hypothetical protein
MKNIYSFLVALIFIFIFVASSSTPKNQTDFKIDIKTENISENEIRVIINTNFPENTPFTITVARGYSRKNNPAEYAGELYYSNASCVKDGEVNFNFSVDDQKWIDEYHQIKKQNESFDYKLTDIETIKDTLEINVLYTPKSEPSKEIKDIIGENGENLKGAEVHKVEMDEGTSGFYVFDKTIKLYNKLKK